MAKVVPVPLQEIFKYVDQNKKKFIERLRLAVEIPSVSASPERRKDVVEMVKWFDGMLQDLDVTTRICDLGTEKNSALALPPVILGTLGDDPEKRTVLIYGHLDVQPASKEDGWDTEPFEMVEKDGKLYGRGTTDDKGPCIAWLNAIEAYKASKVELPVNIKFVFEGMEESNSEGLEELLFKEKDFFGDVDCVCISDNYWLGTKTPCITYGLRGICYFFIEVQGCEKDLHSGIFGGSVNEAMTDLVYLLGSLQDEHGEIAIPGLHDDVEPLTKAETDLFEEVDFDIDAYKGSIGVRKLKHATKEDILMSRWRYPSLSIHGIEGGFWESGSKTVIPKKVIGKFSIRIVPNQDPKKIEDLVVKHLNTQWAKRNSGNHYKAYSVGSGKPWKSSVDHGNYKAAIKATRYVYNVTPNMTREGGSIPVTLTFQELTNKNVMLLPLGAADDGAHSQNEKIDVRNYIEGTKVLAGYLYEVAKSAM